LRHLERVPEVQDFYPLASGIRRNPLAPRLTAGNRFSETDEGCEKLFRLVDRPLFDRARLFEFSYFLGYPACIGKAGRSKFY
jgi:hypothetical protein